MKYIPDVLFANYVDVFVIFLGTKQDSIILAEYRNIHLIKVTD